ncbi:hypothetical protein KJ591_00215 [Patescibacteria group bacterium]|nr:hypothetical protein [Patescibacteria group bacterium]MBU4022781.1 hypothetical protein [Patescibacteria group bacterium]MBU4162020.1 hypothetical protein [Patescibacteria group bacterium]
MNKKLNKSARKHIRQEKARIRRGTSDISKREDMIKQLYAKFDNTAQKEVAPKILKKSKTLKKPKTVKVSE